MNVKQLLAQSQAVLQSSGCESARLDCELLLASEMNVSRSWLYAHADEQVSQPLCNVVQALVQRRAAGEPLAHILGVREFWSLDLQVDHRVLVPRPETECLVEAVLALPLPGETVFVDAGTGSGAIALALASERPGWRGLALDNSADALAVCAQNAAYHSAGQLQLLRAHWLDALAACTVNLVVANPPYIAIEDCHLEAPELRHEPLQALASGHDGLDAIRYLLPGAARCLVRGGYFAVEHGYRQQAAVARLCEEQGMSVELCGSDLSGQPRFVIAQKSAA